MTNKEIIIDGVNVAECKCFYINASHPELQQCINPYCKDLCEENPNCYFKQLKRKEQECEELRKFQKYWSKVEQKNLKLSTQNEIYKQALSEIKQITEKLKTDICSYCSYKGTDSCDPTDTDELEQILQKTQCH